MENMGAVLRQAKLVVNELTDQVDRGEEDLYEAGQRALQPANRLGGIITAEVAERVSEPTMANTIYVDRQPARYKGSETLELKTRFGETVTRTRRRYAVQGGGSFYPLDERLGLRMCGSLSPLLTYLTSLFGASEPYEPAARRLSEALGVTIDATAVQNNSGRVGGKLESRPQQIIEQRQRETPCDLMVVETDGTLSPQIREQPDVHRRASMREPTEYKECNLVAIENRRAGRLAQRWLGGRYGRRSEFEPYLRESALAMGQMKAQTVLFIADGAKHNWDLQQTNFPDAVPILDFYHALEHLGQFCAVFADETAGKQYFARWRERIREGEILQVLAEMKHALSRVADRHEAQKHINYFTTNQERMAYDRYRAHGYPIGSGMVEGAAKYVVGKRFKGSGMRWKRHDNEAVLNARLPFLNGTMEQHFREHSTGPSFHCFSTHCQEGVARA